MELFSFYSIFHHCHLVQAQSNIDSVCEEAKLFSEHMCRVYESYRANITDKETWRNSCSQSEEAFRDYTVRFGHSYCDEFSRKEEARLLVHCIAVSQSHYIFVMNGQIIRNYFSNMRLIVLYLEYFS